ncbi:KAT8 regulatory NSL complex subunit 3 isoform X2 [Coccinella septempunctata]|uniref:KAT8 regulatory NSL complex subunit 3 isoform X2 n=1 Tax=Coccinella septempunctata TaxID=41139 RepID=UPI001D06C0AA|nr:KAT8 regulatory NSL complex subunit 3 isoform X2 [Coccinella septempunctata]
MENEFEQYSVKEEIQEINDGLQDEKKFTSDSLEKTNQSDEKFSLQQTNTIIESELNQGNYYGAENDKEKSSISIDHCYARPWNWKAESSFLRPTKTLFIPKNTSKINFPGQLIPPQDNEELIDIETVENQPTPIYDVNKANQLMEECEKHVKCFKNDEGNNHWEDAILNNNWTPTQIRLFNGVISILNNHQLAKLASKGLDYEAICRRTAIDKSVQRLRRLMATIFWDQKLTQWLHQLLVDNLSTEYLGIYLDILQTLKGKLPSFVDKMISTQASHRAGVMSTENLQPILKRPWDPVMGSLMQDKPKKLPGNPVIVVVPSSPVASNRYMKWINLLSNLATVVNVPFNLGTPGQRLTTTHCADQMFASIRGQVQEIKNQHPNKNIVLVGFNAGAAMALQVAQVETVLAVICLGFSLLTAEGKRGEPEDTLLELQTPVLFVIGQGSTTSSQEDMEDLRERMRVETGLVVVGSADNFLRISKKKKRTEGITQSVVDRCIVDEIGEFISGLILSPFPPQIRQSPVHVPDEPTATAKKAKIERKRYNSNASSLDSEDQTSPMPPRIARPVGRPPGSKSKSKLEVKWAAQVAQGTEPPTPANNNTTTPVNVPTSPSPSSTPPHTPLTLDSSSSDSFLDKQQQQTVDRSSVSNLPTAKIKTLLPNVHPPDPPRQFVRKVRTLKPVAATGSSSSSSSSSSTGNIVTISTSRGSSIKAQHHTPVSAKMQAYGMARHNIVSGSRLSTLLRGGIKTIPPTQPKTSSPAIKILENVTFAPGASKIMSNAIGKTVTVLNSSGGVKHSGANVILMPDGKIKTITSGNIIKGTSYITSKKQLLGNKPPKPVRRFTPFKQSASTSSSSLPPPTNLTTQDIMDLPIIFADDNQVLEGPLQEISPPPPPPPVQQTPPTIAPPPKIISSGSKFVLVNKPMSANQSNTHFVISQNSSKKPTTIYRQTPKYTKIILSKRAPTDEMKSSNIITRIANLSPEISVKKVSSSPMASSSSMGNIDNIDLENELVATSIPKPMFMSSFSHVVNKQGEGYIRTIEKIREGNMRRTFPTITNDDDDDSDPDYVPPKMVKLN